MHGPGLDGVLARQGDGWAVLRPGNVDVDDVRAEAVAALLAAPRVDAWATILASEAGFPTDHRWTVTTDVATRVLSLGTPDGDAVWIRDEAHPERIGRLSARTVHEGGVELLFGG
ncbi:MAG: hypothetical protein R3F59_34930 [Myxococcota bacterium]